jgi:hypothetical protein
MDYRGLKFCLQIIVLMGLLFVTTSKRYTNLGVGECNVLGRSLL